MRFSERVVCAAGGVKDSLNGALKIALKKPGLGRRAVHALAAYPVLPLGRAHPRDKSATLLWGEMRDEQVRASLRQALYDLWKP